MKRITDLPEDIELKGNDVMPVVDVDANVTKQAKMDTLLKFIIPNNAGAHNSIYRGKDITNLFYDGTLSKQITAGTFDDIFIGDYIIGSTSKKKYLVADINYRKRTGYPKETTQNHVLMIPEVNMGNAKMNETNITTGAYVGSQMYTTNLNPFREVIRTDFGVSHILKHCEYFQSATSNGAASAGQWIENTDIDLMNEPMCYGSYIFTPKTSVSGSNTQVPNLYTIDKSQLSLFRMRPDLISNRQWFWLRDVVSSASFANVRSMVMLIGLLLRVRLVFAPLF